MELLVSIATVFRRYVFVLEDPGKPVSNLTHTSHPLAEFLLADSWVLSRESSVNRFRVELV